MSIWVPEVYGVSMMGERNRTSRFVTTNLADSPAPSRLSISREKIVWVVEEPMSMPTLVSVNFSIPSMSSTKSPLENSSIMKSWPSSSSCMLCSNK